MDGLVIAACAVVIAILFFLSCRLTSFARDSCLKFHVKLRNGNTIALLRGKGEEKAIKIAFGRVAWDESHETSGDGRRWDALETCFASRI
jgi:hypothetical protein